jgi:hypothetical protein
LGTVFDYCQWREKKKLQAFIDLDWDAFYFLSHPIHDLLEPLAYWTFSGFNCLHNRWDCDRLMRHVKLSGISLYQWNNKATIINKEFTMHLCDYLHYSDSIGWIYENPCTVMSFLLYH